MAVPVQYLHWWQKPYIGPAAWTASDLSKDQSWIRLLTAAELDDLRAATSVLHAKAVPRAQITAADFNLRHLGVELQRLRSELVDGRGLVLLRGLDVNAYTLDMLETLYLGLGSHLGTPAPQNLKGDLLRSVTDQTISRSEPVDAHGTQGHRGRAEMLPHTDSADLVGLLCVRAAKQGGGTSICSSMTVFNEILATTPDHLTALRRGFHFDMTGKTLSPAGISDARLPVFSLHRGRLSCHFNRARIQVGMDKAGMPLDERETAALLHVSQLAVRSDLALPFDLHPGDLLLLNNWTTLHARDHYEDWPEAGRKRLLLRLWLNNFDPASEQR